MEEPLSWEYILARTARGSLPTEADVPGPAFRRWMFNYGGLAHNTPFLEHFQIGFRYLQACTSSGRTRVGLSSAVVFRE